MKYSFHIFRQYIKRNIILNVFISFLREKNIIVNLSNKPFFRPSPEISGSGSDFKDLKQLVAWKRFIRISG